MDRIHRESYISDVHLNLFIKILLFLIFRQYKKKSNVFSSVAEYVRTFQKTRERKRVGHNERNDLRGGGFGLNRNHLLRRPDGPP